MKKVGIMSMQRIRNYGSFMQAYALKKIIESLDNNVEFIDYKFERSLLPPKKNLASKIIKNINIIQFIKKREAIKNFAYIYDTKFLPLLEINNKNYNKDIDTLVIGSDEVFNCLQPYPVGYSRNLFGFEHDNSRIISYAACFGHTTIDELKKYGIDEEIKKMLNKFSSISVRDNNSKMIVETLTERQVELNLDPVLVYNFDEQKRIDVDIKNYIILYAYPGRLNKKEEKYIKRFAKKYRKKIVSLGSYQRIADITITVSPLEIFSYFENADFVITDTFHGSIFAIKTNTNFCTIIRKSNNNKLSDLLERLSLDSRRINNITEIEKLFNTNINFDKTNNIINKEKEKAINYLRNNI